MFGTDGDSGSWAASEPRAGTKIQSGGVLSNLATYISANTGNGGTHYLLSRVATTFLGSRSNGNSSCAITSQTGIVEDTTNTDSLDAGEYWNLQITCATYTTFTIENIWFLFAPTSGTVAPLQHSVMDYNGTTADQFAALVGSANQYSTTESQWQVNIPCTATLQNGYANCDVNTRTGSTADVLRTRINGANGNIALSFTIGATAEVEDTSNTDSVVAGDLVNWHWDNGGTGGRANLRGVRLELAATDQFVMLGNRLSGASQQDNYLPIWGTSTRYTTALNTEANAQCRADVAFTWSRLWGNTSDSWTGTIRTRINGADGNQSISWSAANGEVEDTSNSDSVVVDDLICYFNDYTSGTVNVRGLSSLATLPVGGPAPLSAFVYGRSSRGTISS